MKILITGGTVFVSRFAAEYFAKKHEVSVLNRNTRPQVPGVALIEADRHDLGNCLKGRHFDAVLDITAYNADDVNNLLNVLDSFDQYLLISSSAVYPETLLQPFSEEQPCGSWKFCWTNDRRIPSTMLAIRKPFPFVNGWKRATPLSEKSWSSARFPPRILSATTSRFTIMPISWMYPGSKS